MTPTPVAPRTSVAPVAPIAPIASVPTLARRHTRTRTRLLTLAALTALALVTTLGSGARPTAPRATPGTPHVLTRAHPHATVAGLRQRARRLPRAVRPHVLAGLAAPAAPAAQRVAPARPASSAPPVSAALTQLLGLINAERAQAGVAPLTLAPTLDAIALQRSQDMLARHYFAHQIPGGGLVFDLLDRAHVAYTMAGENLAENNYRAFYPPAQVLAQTNADLMHSPEHRANLLAPTYRTLGLGLAVAPDSATLILTELFVQP